MKISDAVLVLLSEAPRTPAQLASALQTEDRFREVNHRRVGRGPHIAQVYASMSALRSKKELKS